MSMQRWMIFADGRDALDSLVGGPAVALGTGQGRLLGRLALSCQF